MEVLDNSKGTLYFVMGKTRLYMVYCMNAYLLWENTLPGLVYCCLNPSLQENKVYKDQKDFPEGFLPNSAFWCFQALCEHLLILQVYCKTDPGESGYIDAVTRQDILHL